MYLNNGGEPNSDGGGSPVAIFGPALSAYISGSFVLLLRGKPFPNLPLNIVDVRRG